MTTMTARSVQVALGVTGSVTSIKFTGSVISMATLSVTKVTDLSTYQPFNFAAFMMTIYIPTNQLSVTNQL